MIEIGLIILYIAIIALLGKRGTSILIRTLTGRRTTEMKTELRSVQRGCENEAG